MQHDPMRPAITLGDAEHRHLLILAMSGPGHSADDSDYLHHELDRASLVPDTQLAPDVVRVGSTVTFRTDDGGNQTVTLVYPTRVDAIAGKIAVTSPVGAALIGLRPGQTITRMGRDGGFRTFAVISVIPPVARQ